MAYSVQRQSCITPSLQHPITPSYWGCAASPVHNSPTPPSPAAHMARNEQLVRSISCSRFWKRNVIVLNLVEDDFFWIDAHRGETVFQGIQIFGAREDVIGAGELL